MIIEFNNVAGIIRDVPPINLPANVWTGGNNIRFVNGQAEKSNGYDTVFGDLLGSPIWLLQVRDTLNVRWIYTSDQNVYVTDGAAHFDITPLAPLSSAVRWSGGVLGTIPFINNGADAPLMWSPAINTTPMVALSNWPAATTCQIMRSFGSYLIALDVTKGTNRFPQMVKWSSSADPGLVPGSWDETDPTNDAGENVLVQTSDRVVDGLPLGDQFFIYKQGSTHSMRRIGDPAFVFDFDEVFSTSGILAPNCVVEYKDRHYVLTQTDVVVHNGQTPVSIIDEKNRQFLFDSIDTENFENCFLQVHESVEEIWVCYPTTGNVYANVALTYSITDGTWGVRDLGGASFIASGVVQENQATTWDAAVGTWDEQVGVWDSRRFRPYEVELLAAMPLTSTLAQMDITNANDGVPFVSSVERHAIPIAGSNGKINTNRFKYIASVFPRVHAQNGTIINVSIGTELEYQGGILWTAPYPFEVGVDNKVDFDVSGRTISIKFESSAVVAWELSGFDLDVVLDGDY